MIRLLVRNGGGGGRLLDLAFLVIAGVVWQVASRDAAAQDGEAIRGRIALLRHGDNTVEFGFQPQDHPRILPERRWFPADATIGRWLSSSPVVQAGLELGRINARRLADGRIDVSVGQSVSIGTRLGSQGNVGPSTATSVTKHVHIEVWTGRRTSAACRALGTINPFDSSNGGLESR